VLPERQLLLQWLGRSARRMQARSRLRELGWMMCTVLSALGLYVLLDTLGVPIPALVALTALLLLAVGAAAAFFAWRCVHRTDLSSAAREADSRLDLKDELKTAFWFARGDVPSATEVLVLRHAAETVRCLDPRAAFPVRMPGNFGAAAVLGVIAFGLAFARHDTTHPAGSGVALAGDLKADARVLPRGANTEEEGVFRFDARGLLSAPKPQGESELWSKAEELAQSLKSAEERAELQRAIRVHDVKRVRELIEPAEQAALSVPAGPDARAQAGQVSAEVAQGILERLQSLDQGSSEAKREDPALAVGDHEGGVPGWRDNGAQQSERRDTDQHTTMDALNDALRALSQAATGDRSMANSPPGETSQNNGRTNINGGAMGMRVNTSEAGAGGEDTPPDAPSGGVGEPVLGKPTLRLAAQLQRLSAGTAHNESAAGAAEGFYAATQAQAARLDFTPAQVAEPSAGEAALTREQVPIAYRASVKRYFLTEHGKER
jgi:hypothetical protein